jgi:acyl dehydratase
MPIEPDTLLNFPIAERRQRFTRQDAAFYALSIGLGQDPLEEHQLDLVDPARARWAMPSMAMVLGYPGFWLADPATGVDARQVLHGTQEVMLLQPIPAAGEVIGRSRVTGLTDRGAGKMALLYSERQLFDAHTDTLLAICKQTHVLLGQGGFGGPSEPGKPRHLLPARDPDITLDLQTRPEQALYYRLNGDDNPIHIDPAAARRAGFARPILHGMCSAGVIVHALVRALGNYDPTRLISFELRFSAPVYPGETLTIDLWNDGSFRARVAARATVVIDHGKATFVRERIP